MLLLLSFLFYDSNLKVSVDPKMNFKMSDAYLNHIGGHFLDIVTFPTEYYATPSLIL